MAEIKIKTNEILKRELEKAENLCSGLASIASEKMENEYLDIIDNFYMEYDPIEYVRHHERGTYPERGLEKTYEKVLKREEDGTKVTYKGGITISPNNMYDGYRGTHEQVLESFLSGFHGLPTWHGFENKFPPIRSNIIPRREILNYYEKILPREMRQFAKFKYRIVKRSITGATFGKR